MTSQLRSSREGFPTATPYLIVRDATSALEFYKQAFGAVELDRLTGPGGRVMHAEIKIGDSPIMIGEHSDVPPATALLVPPVSIHLYVQDVDALFRQAVAAGAKEFYPVKDQFYADREGGVVDPLGIVWWIATHKEDVSPQEMEKRAAAAGQR